MFGEPRPTCLHPFAEIRGAKPHGGLDTRAICCSISALTGSTSASSLHAARRPLAGSARVVDEVHGFRSFDQRDLLGFVDGTENPDGPGGAEAVGDRR